MRKLSRKYKVFFTQGCESGFGCFGFWNEVSSRSGFQNMVGAETESGFQNLVGSVSRTCLNIKVWNASKIEILIVSINRPNWWYSIEI